MILHINYDNDGVRLLMLSLVATGEDIGSLTESLKQDGMLVQDTDGTTILSDKALAWLEATTWFDDTGETVQETKSRLTERQLRERTTRLAKQMMQYWPVGMRREQGITTSWRGNSDQVAARLRMVEEVLKYTDDQILRAARLYTSSFSHDNTYMRGLRNFILKKDGVNPDDGCDSLLLELLEQMDDVFVSKKKKKTQLR